MDNLNEHIRRLEEKVAALEARLEKLAEKETRDVTALMGCDDVLDKHRKASDAELSDVFDRIINIELKLFPHLMTDIDQLNRVIGESDNKAYNPLDFRERPPKSR